MKWNEKQSAIDAENLYSQVKYIYSKTFSIAWAAGIAKEPEKEWASLRRQQTLPEATERQRRVKDTFHADLELH